MLMDPDSQVAGRFAVTQVGSQCRQYACPQSNTVHMLLQGMCPGLQGQKVKSHHHKVTVVTFFKKGSQVTVKEEHV